MPTVEELSQYYAKHFDYDWYERRLLLKKIQAQHRWKRMERLFKEHGIRRGALLDIGCGHGMFVRAASRTGWNASGLDYPSKATSYAKNVMHLNVVEDELTAAIKSGKLPQAQFDVVTAWHVLEHSSNVMEFLSDTAKLLKPGGRLLLAVPNAESHGMKKMRESWVWCQQPFVHVVHFNSASLSQAVNRVGLKIVSTWSRDTWDANRIYDEDMRIRGLILRRFTKHPKVSFFLEEAIRLCSYGLGCYDHWLFGRECEQMDGSELLLLAERSNP
jgi:2-polyprenyl-3-methyl-5-hydroxy-6-metoxy-1,4-benzoquinol methylase